MRAKPMCLYVKTSLYGLCVKSRYKRGAKVHFFLKILRGCLNFDFYDFM
jgi:hypothetical protein